MTPPDGHEWTMRSKSGHVRTWDCKRCGGYRSEWFGNAPKPEDKAWVRGGMYKCGEAVATGVLES